MNTEWGTDRGEEQNWTINFTWAAGFLVTTFHFIWNHRHYNHTNPLKTFYFVTLPTVVVSGTLTTQIIFLGLPLCAQVKLIGCFVVNTSAEARWVDLKEKWGPIKTLNILRKSRLKLTRSAHWTPAPTHPQVVHFLCHWFNLRTGYITSCRKFLFKHWSTRQLICCSR